VREGIQSLLAELGEGSCLALCICEIGKPRLSEEEAIGFIIKGIQKGYIYYDENNRNNPKNCFVENRDAFMDIVSGQKGWTSSTEKAEYRPRKDERIIECWRWNEKVNLKIINHTHFKLPNWDPYKNSNTLKYGYLESLRVFRRKAL